MDSLAGRESGEPQRFREQAQREIDALHDAFNKKIADLEQVKHTFRVTISDDSHFRYTCSFSYLLRHFQVFFLITNYQFLLLKGCLKDG